ncbi:hypothetical protein M902_2669 [Bacteriovorax sp. BAL6_X]|uniref:hypothetical protein n=1 Tax=Bacteriovorax sp. BAL6_X TaxID=1201290 RepID=UPI00038600AC|nr:hypothetical protein [Bacteriovorax sp. BAL6_X]EPZ51497.1 hypothetical protein M902_2669 [Bacteriovorax sp. BAL6_X]
MKGIILTLIFLSFALGHFEVFATTNCPTGQVFNASLNRCMYTEGSIKNRDEYQDCDSKSSESERNACMKAAADTRQQKTVNELNAGRVSDSEVESKGKGNLITGFAEAWGIVTGVTALVVPKFFNGDDSMSVDSSGNQQNNANSNSSNVSKDENRSSCKSCMLVGAVSAYSFYQTKVNKEDVKKKTKEFKEEYEEISKDPETMKNAQIAAFDMLEKEQQYLADVSSKQAKQYKTLALGYTAAAAVAVYETFSSFGTSCMNQSPGEAGGASKWNFSDMANGFRSITNNPCTVIVASAVTVPAALTVSNQAKKNNKDANSNVEQIKVLKEKYVKSVASFCPDGRDSLSNPACYCYTAQGNKNPNREKSKTCQDYWNKYNGSFITSADSTRAAQNNNPQGCFYVDGKFDRECNCRKLKNNKGENACKKITVSPTALSSLGGLDVSEAIRAANATTQGNGGTYNASTTDAQAAMAAKAMDAIKKKLENPFKKNTGLGLSKISDELAKQAGKYGDNNNVSIFNGSGASEAFARLRPTEPSFQNAVESVSAKLPAKGLAAPTKKTVRKTTNNDTNRWKFDDSSSSQVLSFGAGAGNGDSKKKYDYGDNDIIKDKSVSIFKVISHRYVQSGLKKLFSE